MNTATKTETTALQTIDAVTDVLPTTTSASLILSGDGMERIFKFAEMMAQSVVSVPLHLRGKPADCLAIVMQATQWGMNPFAVAQKTHVVNGTLGYEAQLVNAALQATGAIDGEFSYEYKGDGENTECRVGAIPAGKRDITWGEWLIASKVTTKNSPLWKTNIRQQMGYLQVKNWGRAFKPAAILGVNTTDELAERPPTAKHMGNADVVDEPHVELGPVLADVGKLSTDADAAKMWKEQSVRFRAQQGDYQTLKQAIIDRRKAIKDAAASPAPAAAIADEPKATYATVMERLIRAKTMDALDVAADWIGEVADPAQRAELSGKYEEFKAKLS